MPACWSWWNCLPTSKKAGSPADTSRLQMCPRTDGAGNSFMSWSRPAENRLSSSALAPTAKKGAKVTMPTCTAQTPDKNIRRAFTLIEAMLAMAIAGLMVSIAVVNFAGAYRRSTFRGQLQDLVSNMQRAVRAAHQSGRRYEIIIDLIEHKYIGTLYASGSIGCIYNEIRHIEPKINKFN